MKTAACLFSLAKLIPTETICTKHLSLSLCDTYINNPLPPEKKKKTSVQAKRLLLIICPLDKLPS